MWWQIYPHAALWRKAIFNFTDRCRLMLYNLFFGHLANYLPRFDYGGEWHVVGLLSFCWAL